MLGSRMIMTRTPQAAAQHLPDHAEDVFHRLKEPDLGLDEVKKLAKDADTWGEENKSMPLAGGRNLVALSLVCRYHLDRANWTRSCHLPYLHAV